VIRRLLPWIALVVVVVGALAIGAGRGSGHRSLESHVNHVAAQVKCPTCQGLSAAESDAAASRAIRDEIRTRITQGQSDAQIKAFLVSRFGKDILLKPDAGGFGSLVWALPVVALLCGAAGLGFAFARWRSRARVAATPADRALVEDALRG
jgi:cytochrome c-type biogenesis protein CcmH